jgi:lambda family phage portal protein
VLEWLKRSTAPAPVDQAKPSRMPAIGRHMARMFQAGKQDRLQSEWPTMPLPADDIIRRNQRVLVARSREQAINNDYARSFLRMCRQNIVGPRGVQLQAQPRDADGSVDNLAADAIEAAFREWGHAKHCDVAGVQSWRALQGLAVTTAARDGEFMFMKVFGADAGEFGFALQALDPQRCAPDFDENRRRDGTFIRSGIEFNKYGRPLAYYFTATDEEETQVYSYGGRRFVRVPADRIIHGFLHDMTGQKRGLPWMGSALWRMNQLKGFEDAALVNARTAAAKGGFFEWQEGYGPEQDEDDELFMEAEPGAFQELPAGVRFKEWNPQYPNGEYAVYTKAMLRGIASGLGVAYNNLANDLEGVNFSSIRQGALDEREAWKELQEWLIETLIEPVFLEWLPRALLRGIALPNGATLRPERIEKYSEVVWQPRRWAWIDPKSEVAAAVASKNNLLTSPGQIIRDTGRDPDTVWREMAADIAAMRAAGIPDEIITQAMGQRVTGGGGNDRPPETE